MHDGITAERCNFADLCSMDSLGFWQEVVWIREFGKEIESEVGKEIESSIWYPCLNYCPNKLDSKKQQSDTSKTCVQRSVQRSIRLVNI